MHRAPAKSPGCGSWWTATCMMRLFRVFPPIARSLRLTTRPFSFARWPWLLGDIVFPLASPAITRRLLRRLGSCWVPPLICSRITSRLAGGREMSSTTMRPKWLRNRRLARCSRRQKSIGNSSSDGLLSITPSLSGQCGTASSRFLGHTKKATPPVRLQAPARAANRVQLKRRRLAPQDIESSE